MKKNLFYILKMNDSLINQVNNVNPADTKMCEAAAKKKKKPQTKWTL